MKMQLLVDNKFKMIPVRDLLHTHCPTMTGSREGIMPRHSPWGSLVQQKIINSCGFISTDTIQAHIQSWMDC